jgi:general secretion pathway protein G
MKICRRRTGRPAFAHPERALRRAPSRPKRRESGFTLIELLLVVVIIGILAAIVVPKLTGRTDDARIGAAQADIKSISTALSMYEGDNGRFPPALEALLVKPTNPEPPKWKGPYLESREIPKDPWGHEYLYVYPSPRGANMYELLSAGADGQPGTGDDIEKP